ncbi:MAG: hypothetical protein GY795_03535 [Desulfobacterales bacterium]|nr:hypothetical protein [Desulfobacterales bacterium]
MKDYGLIRQAYSEVEKYYIKIIDDAVSQKNNSKYSKYLELSRISEYAYFVLFWGQFESFINDKAFEIEGDNFREIGFMLRVQLSVSPTHEFYTEIDQYYYWRCELAHGRISEFPELTLPTIFDKIEEITETITNSPLPLGEDFSDFFKE